MAVGRSRYLEMAVDMALSLREQTDLPIALATDDRLGERVDRRYPGVFDELRHVPARFLRGRALKYGAAAASPYEESIFLDADSIVLGSLDSLWDALDDTSMAMVGELLTNAQDENHHGFSTRALMRRFSLDRYLKSNSGLFCFRRSEALAVFEECLTCYLHEARPALRGSILLGRWLGDEIAFGIVGGRRRLGTLPQPSPMYWPQEIERIDLYRPEKPLLHLIWPLPDDALETLVATTGARRARHGVIGDAERHWRQEVRSLRRMALRRRVLERRPAVPRSLRPVRPRASAGR